MPRLFSAVLLGLPFLQVIVCDELSNELAKASLFFEISVCLLLRPFTTFSITVTAE